MKKSSTTEVARFFVAGLVFTDVDVNVLKLKQGAKLDLVREPENPHDDEAIRVEYKGKKLGYVPAKCNRDLDQAGNGIILRKNIESGVPIRAVVAQHARTNPTHRQILVSCLVKNEAPRKSSLAVKSF